MTKYRQPTNAPTPKVTGATIGSGSGVTFAIVVMAALKVWNPEVYESVKEVPELTLALGGVFTTLTTFIGGWMTWDRA